MGTGSWSAQSWASYSKKSGIDKAKTVSQIYQSNSINPSLSPFGVNFRESCDSIEHPNSTPIIVGLDVTGSMGSTATKIAQSQLNTFITETMANDIKEWLLKYDLQNEFMFNCHSIIQQTACEKRDIGYLCYLPVAYIKFLQKDEKQKAEQKETEFYGSVGDKINIEFSFAELVKVIDGTFGGCFLYKFISGKNVFMWFASNPQELDGCNHLTGRIKEQKEYAGEKQTIVTRCKLS